MKRKCYCSIIVMLLGLTAHAEPTLQYAQSAIVMDVASGRILYDYHADEPRIPASLTKIVSLTLAYQAIKNTSLSYTTAIEVSERAAMYNMPPRSSLMALEPGQKLTLYDLMLGMAVASGNDAAVALAETVSGDVESFVEQMNRLMREIGATQSHFVDPAGIEDSNIITAREYALLVRYYLQNFPQALHDLHQVTSFQYPTLQQMNHQGRMRYTKTYTNGNGLLKTYEGVDGLKTGYIDESGYNLVATAKRGDMRLIAVILGVQAPGSQTGSLRREADAKVLLDYGFETFHYYDVTEHLNFLDIYQSPLIGGVKNSVDLKLGSDTKIPYPLREDEWSGSELRPQLSVLHAPVEIGKTIGELQLFINGEEHWHSEFSTKERVDRLPFWLYINELVEIKLKGIFGVR